MATWLAGWPPVGGRLPRYEQSSVPWTCASWRPSAGRARRMPQRPPRHLEIASMLATDSLRRLEGRTREAYRSLREDGPEFILTWARVRNSVRGWLTGPDARLLFAYAQRGPGRGAIVEIGS